MGDAHMTLDTQRNGGLVVYPTQLDRIEAKLDTLIAALAEDGDEERPERTLDGEAVGGERDQTQGLG